MSFAGTTSTMNAGGSPDPPLFSDHDPALPIRREGVCQVLWQAADRAIEALGVGEDIEKKVGEYSRGMRQRLGVAIAMLWKP